MNKIQEKLIKNLQEIKWKVDDISGLLTELNLTADDSLYDLYMNFPTYDTIKEMIMLIEKSTK